MQTADAAQSDRSELRNRAIVVLGGNAFTKPGEELTMAGQFRFAHEALSCLQPLLTGEYELVLTHGNGPQVGHILTRVEESLGKAYTIPLEVCVAESEGEIGYVLEQTLYNLAAEHGANRPIATLLTQVIVDGDDPAFRNPTKPVGPFFTREAAEELRRKGLPVREDAGRGYRRVVPSPEPVEILETPVIEQLLDAGVLVIAAGGGGIPVVRKDNRLQGVEAVIDKDLASALLGGVLGARLMVVLTGVPCAYLNFGTPDREPLGRIDVQRAREYLAEGHFAPGSMQPKMEAAIRFAARPGARSVICDPASLADALQGNAGTAIENGDL